MRELIFLILSTVLYPSCFKRYDIDLVKEKSIFFDSIGYKIFKNYQIHNMRKGKKASYQVSRYDTSHDYAIIKLFPKSEIEKNFKKDTVNIGFVNSFKEIDCHYLEYRNGGVRLDFNYGNKNYVMFKNYVDKNINLPFDTTKAIKIDNNWSYFVFRKPNWH